MIKAIIVDCFGVLTTDHWKQFVATLPAEQQGPVHQLNHAYDQGHLSKADFLAAVQELTGQVSRYTDKLLDNETAKNTQLLDYIAELRSRGYKIALLSNVATIWIREEFLTPTEQQLFDVFIFSYEVGLVKPEPKIYQLTVERLGLEADECVMIDDIERYCAVAREQGLQAIVYDNFAQCKTELERVLSSRA
ncbi:MAG TPA: HAD family phosphatase [Candidatus Saccharimonadales bacterium]|nr:HAD family phosphatase [Candidatus Saccharimonadales bacterium]